MIDFEDVQVRARVAVEVADAVVLIGEVESDGGSDLDDACGEPAPS